MPTVRPAYMEEASLEGIISPRISSKKPWIIFGEGQLGHLVCDLKIRSINLSIDGFLINEN